MQIGQKLPKFSLPNQTGAFKSDADFSDQNLIIFFYPRDATPGCTKEANEFNESLAEFAALNAAIIGVSKDSVKSHLKFAEKHGFNFDLLSDETSDLCETFEVWKEKSMYGKKFMGIERSTFLFDKSGTLKYTWRKVRVPGHVDDVKKMLETL